MAEQSRWVTLRRTSPSGKTLFLCRSCERVSPTPDKLCPGAYSLRGLDCSEWPRRGDWTPEKSAIAADLAEARERVRPTVENERKGHDA